MGSDIFWGTSRSTIEHFIYPMSALAHKKQISAGGILFRNSENGIHLALIRRSTPRKKPIWCLPKGWVEPGETFEDAALREVQEETGLQGKILDKLGVISYSFYDKYSKSRIHKSVHFFLMEYVTGNTSGHDDEVEEARWFNLIDAQQHLSYPTERDIFVKALSIFRK